MVCDIIHENDLPSEHNIKENMYLVSFHAIILHGKLFALLLVF